MRREALSTTRRQRRALVADNRRQPEMLRRVPRDEWPEAVTRADNPPFAVFRSRDFLLQIFTHEGVFRLSICRTEITGDQWEDGISWDDLQRLKRECGLGDKCAIEVFPPDDQVVNVANMRHLWIVKSPPFLWGATNKDPTL